MFHQLFSLRRIAAAALAAAAAFTAPVTPARAESGQPPVIAEYGQCWRYFSDPDGDFLVYNVDMRVTDADSAVVKRRILVLDKNGAVTFDWRNDEQPWSDPTIWRLKTGITAGITVGDPNQEGQYVDSTVIMTAVDEEGNEAAPVILRASPPPTEPGGPVVRSVEVDPSKPKVIVSGVGFSKRSRLTINGWDIDPGDVSIGADKKTITVEGPPATAVLEAGTANRFEVTKGRRHSNPYFVKY